MEFFTYLFKVNIAIMLFYGVYRLFFRQDTFFQWKRFALLSIIFISLLYPAIDISRQVLSNHQLKNFIEIINIPVYNLPELVITGNASNPAYHFPQVVLTIYLLLSTFLFIRIFLHVRIIAKMLKHTVKKVLLGRTVYESSELKTPFSFFGWIALDSSRYSKKELKEILLHETTHVAQWHSIDTLFAELLCAFCWFNPFVWLLKTEIRMNLEFLADRSVLSSGCSAEHYQFHLLRLSYHKAATTITNNFNVSLLKKRIFMMNKKQTSYLSLWKYSLIPALFVMLLLINCTSKTETKQNVEQKDYFEVFDKLLIESAVEQLNNETSDEKGTIYTHVEVMPDFPGGEPELMKWLKDNIAYPASAQEQGIQGRVMLRFVVKADGSISNIEIYKSLDAACDSAAVKAIKKMPKWIPGKQNGVPVPVYYNLPVVFKLQNAN